MTDEESRSRDDQRTGNLSAVTDDLELGDEQPPPTERVMVHVASMFERFEATVVGSTGELLSTAQVLAGEAISAVARTNPLISSPVAQQILDGVAKVVDIQFRMSEDLLTRWHHFGREVLQAAKPLWSNGTLKEVDDDG